VVHRMRGVRHLRRYLLWRDSFVVQHRFPGASLCLVQYERKAALRENGCDAVAQYSLR
jgi:hypothetical protein